MTHPPQEVLRGYVGGTAELTRGLLVEAHLTLCRMCPTLIARHGDAADRLPEATVDDQLMVPPFERVWAAVEQLGRRASFRAAAVLPPSLLASVSHPAGWRWIVLWPARVRSALLARDPETGSTLYLSYYPANSTYPRHRHVGLEENVILSGGYWNGEVHVEAGDWVIGAPGTEHAPATGRDEECWCLSRIEPPGVQFRGWREWARRLFFS